jgi:cytochrome c
LNPVFALGAALFALVACLVDVNMAKAAEPFTFEGHGGPVRAIYIAPDGQFAITASFDYSLISWAIEPDGPRQLHRFDGHNAAVNDVAVTPLRDIAVSVGDDGLVIVWDMEENRMLHQFQGHAGKVLGVAVSNNGHLAASAGWDHTARLWNLRNMEPGPVLEGHRGNVNAVEFSLDGRRLFTASFDGTIRAWNSETGAADGIIYRHGWGVNVMRLLPDGTHILFGAIDGIVGFVDIETGEMTGLADLEGPVLAVASWPQHRLAASGGGDGTIQVWKMAGWELIHELEDPYGPAWSLAISGDGTTIFRTGLDDFVAGWQISPRQNFEPVASVFPRRFQLREDMSMGEREFTRKCSICHSLVADDGHRAGPSLYNLFGRHAGSLPDYPYSPGLENSDIVWNVETIGRLFDEGPEVVTPGSKMPLQRLKDVEHRDALIEYLKIATAPINDAIINPTNPPRANAPRLDAGGQQQE